MVVCIYFQKGNCRYGQKCRFEHVYGSQYSYRASSQQSTTQNSGFAQTSNNQASSIFRSAVQNTNQSVFGQNPPNRASVFDRLGPQTNDHQKAQSIFAQANQNVFGQVNPQSTQNPFMSNAQSVFAQANRNITPQNPNVFSSAPNHNVFRAAQSQNALNLAQSSAANLFASAAMSTFGQHQQKSDPSQNIFHISEKPSNVFRNANNSFEQYQLCDENYYSLLEELNKSDIEAFQSTDFKLGFIPELPPPKSLCV